MPIDIRCVTCGESVISTTRSHGPAIEECRLEAKLTALRARLAEVEGERDEWKREAYASDAEAAVVGSRADRAEASLSEALAVLGKIRLYVGGRSNLRREDMDLLECIDALIAGSTAQENSAGIKRCTTSLGTVCPPGEPCDCDEMTALYADPPTGTTPEAPGGEFLKEKP